MLDKVNNLLSQKLQLICKNKGFTQEALAGNQLIEFRLEANVNTYAAYMNETDSTRLVTPEIQKLITENL